MAFPFSWSYPVNIKVRVIEIAALPQYRRVSSQHRIRGGFFIELPLLSGGRGIILEK